MYTYVYNNETFEFDVLNGKGEFVTSFFHAIDAQNYCDTVNKELKNALQK